MAKLICAHCGTTDEVKLQAQGTLLGEIALWFLMVIAAPFTMGISIIIAIGFSLWRATDKKKICSSCGHDELVGTETPRGKKLMQEYN